MKTITRRLSRRRRGLTLVECFVVVIALAVLAAVLLPGFRQPRARPSRIICANNLKQVGLAFRVYASDNHDRFPMSVPGGEWRVADWQVETLRIWSFSNELSALKLLVCPADSRVAAKDSASLAVTNISYFIALEADERHPQRWLSGDRNLRLRAQPLGPGAVTLTTNQIVGWAAGLHTGTYNPTGAGNLLLSDGSVQAPPSRRLRAYLMASDVATNHLLIP